MCWFDTLILISIVYCNIFFYIIILFPTIKNFFCQYNILISIFYYDFRGKLVRTFRSIFIPKNKVCWS